MVYFVEERKGKERHMINNISQIISNLIIFNVSMFKEDDKSMVEENKKLKCD